MTNISKGEKDLHCNGVSKEGCEGWQRNKRHSRGKVAGTRQHNLQAPRIPKGSLRATAVGY